MVQKKCKTEIKTKKIKIPKINNLRIRLFWHVWGHHIKSLEIRSNIENLLPQNLKIIHLEKKGLCRKNKGEKIMKKVSTERYKTKNIKFNESNLLKGAEQQADNRIEDRTMNQEKQRPST